MASISFQLWGCGGPCSPNSCSRNIPSLELTNPSKLVGLFSFSIAREDYLICRKMARYSPHQRHKTLEICKRNIIREFDSSFESIGLFEFLNVVGFVHLAASGCAL